MINKGMKLAGRYVIDSVIGEGGGGIVYKAYDSNLQSYVVVKQIKEAAASFLECRTEADILKGLKHENLPKVLDFFENEGKIYTVIDFIEGVSLSQALKTEGRFLQKQVLPWARQLARALACLHSQRPPIIHSDIKPANIMWNRETGKVCLIDFNISLVFNRGQKNITWLSGGYSPPEQYQTMDKYCSYLEHAIGGATRNQQGNSRAAGGGERTDGDGDSRPTRIFDRRALAALEPVVRGPIDERSDIYSFGAAMYHLLVGRKPDLHFQNIIPISAYDIELSEGFCHIIEKCMELDPARRYQNGMELEAALDNIYELDSEYRAFRKRRLCSRIVTAAMIAGGAVLLAGGFFVRDREQEASYRTYVQEAQLCLEEGEYGEAEDFLAKARKIDENRVDADELELLRLYRMGDYALCSETGIRMLSQRQYRLKSAQDRARMGNLYYLIGSGYLENGQEKEALPYMEEALRYVEDNALFYRDYAIALARSGKVKEAEGVLKEAAAAALDQDSMGFAQGEISFAKQDYFTAQSTLQDVIRNTGDIRLKERALLLLNRMYLKCGAEYLDTAITMLEQEKEGWNPAALLNLSEALAKDYLLRAREKADPGDTLRALNEYIELYNSGHKTMRIMENIGIIYRELGKGEQAEQMAQQMLAQYPGDYRGHKLLAFLELDRQQTLPNERRNYQNFQICYQNADKLYQKAEGASDPEMELLGQMYEDLRSGGWY